MRGPAAPGWLLVALCAATGAYCLLRMRGVGTEARRAAGAEALMGFGMAAMAVPAAFLPLPPRAWLAWAVVFGADALRALWAARTCPPHLHHAVGALAMAYMAAVMYAAPGHHGGHGDAGASPVTGALLLYFAGYVLWSGVRLVPVTAAAGGTAGAAGGPGWAGRPELARACRLSMGIAMLVMLPAL